MGSMIDRQLYMEGRSAGAGRPPPAARRGGSVLRPAAPGREPEGLTSRHGRMQQRPRELQ